MYPFHPLILSRLYERNKASLFINRYAVTCPSSKIYVQYGYINIDQKHYHFLSIRAVGPLGLGDLQILYSALDIVNAGTHINDASAVSKPNLLQFTQGKK